jgi:hypothetical protein
LEGTSGNRAACYAALTASTPRRLAGLANQAGFDM